MWPFTKQPPKPLFLTNTLSGAKEAFRKKDRGPVRMYSCGPTVYGPQHIGNLRAAVFSDTVARTVKAAGYTLKRVINITDVGHLVGDGDEGEDKMSVGALREKTTPEAIAKRYTKQYLDDIAALNIDTKDITFPRATEYIKEQIAMIQTLQKKGLAYTTSDGVYFDTQKFDTYGELGNVKNIKLEAGTRVALGQKKNEHDFVLWRTAKEHDLQQWDSPWGRGNPGWSIECSAMATSILGPTLDIHTGGQDHIQVHHNNEIAQSEGATGIKPYVRYWLHNAFLTIGGEKISKSLGNTYTLDDVRARGIHPLTLRYLFLQAHYRTPISFSWESLQAAENGLKILWKLSREVARASDRREQVSQEAEYILKLACDDLKTPQVIGQLWGMLQSTESARKKWYLIVHVEKILGLSLTNPPEDTPLEIPEEIRALIEERENARTEKDFARSDLLRETLEGKGYRIQDGPKGPVIERI